MGTVALTADTFEDTVTREGITLVDWWASWCGPSPVRAPGSRSASPRPTTGSSSWPGSSTDRAEGLPHLVQTGPCTACPRGRGGTWRDVVPHTSSTQRGLLCT